ncbi:MAG TPA: AAA family ATPase [Solirubrobacterales bacterium]|nr:AAA family ATPase [Solirubrobacterales bacterium]
MAVEETTLFERDAELARIAAALDPAGGGAGVGYVEGHAGIGKTTVLETVRDDIGAGGTQVLFARGEELEREFSFGVVRQLFERLLFDAAEAERERLLAGPARLAAVALGLDDERGPNPDSPFAILNALLWLTTNLAEAAQIVLMLDDAHWADAPSLRYLDYLAARIEDLPVGVVLAARPFELADAEPESAAELLARVRRRSSVELVRLGPLGPASTATILERRFGRAPEPRFASSCHRASAGNPFLLNELADALLFDRVAPEDAAAERIGDLGPETVAHSLLLRLSHLPAAAGPVTEAVAVLGPRAELRHVAALTGLPAAELATAAAALTSANVLQAGRPLRFVHPIVRQAVYADLSVAVCTRLHAAAAMALEEQGTSVAEVAPHLLLVEPANDAAVVATLREAATAALGQGAADLAQTYLERALDEPPEAEVEPRVLAELGIAEATRARDLPAASAHLEEAVARSPEGRRRARWVEIAARARLFAGDPPGGAELLAAERRSLDHPHGEVGLMLLAQEAGIALLQPPIAAATLTELEDFEDLPGESAAELGVLAELAGKRWIEGRIETAAALAERALAGGRLLAAEGPVATTFTHAAAILLDADRIEEAVRALDAGIELARAQGSLLGISSLTGLRTVAAWKRGLPGEALAEARVAVDLLEIGRAPIIDPIQWGYLALTEVERGELEAAEEALVRGRCGPDLPQLTYMEVPFLARARLRLAQARPEDALADIAELEDRRRRLGVRHMKVAWWGTAIEAALAVGDRERALGFADEQLRLSREWSTAGSRGRALAGRGLALGGAAGVELLEEGVARLAESPAGLDHARALIDLGALLRREGHRAEAREPLRRGLEAARSRGALVLARRAHEELLTAGARPRRLQFSGVEALTASERRVAELAAAGSSNREIAATLFITVRTVENHLSRTYRKLGIGSRVELPAALRGEQDS